MGFAGRHTAGQEDSDTAVGPGSHSLSGRCWSSGKRNEGGSKAPGRRWREGEAYTEGEAREGTLPLIPQLCALRPLGGRLLEKHVIVTGQSYSGTLDSWILSLERGYTAT